MVSNFENVVFPNEILEGMNIEAFTLAPWDHRIGVAILSGKHENMYVLRLYQVIQEEDQQYYPTHELEAFAFQKRNELNEFLEKLPNLSAIELLLIMHQQPTMHH